MLDLEKLTDDELVVLDSAVMRQVLRAKDEPESFAGRYRQTYQRLYDSLEGEIEQRARR